MGNRAPKVGTLSHKCLDSFLTQLEKVLNPGEQVQTAERMGRALTLTNAVTSLHHNNGVSHAPTEPEQPRCGFLLNLTLRKPPVFGVVWFGLGRACSVWKFSGQGSIPCHRLPAVAQW